MIASAPQSLITGASSGLGRAALSLLLDNEIAELTDGVVHAISRRAADDGQLLALQRRFPERLQLHSVDLSKDADLERLSRALSDCPPLRLVFHAAGVLHDPQLRPEKSLTQIRRDQLERAFTLNAYAPILLAKAILPLLRGRHRCTFASVSARVGSIGDNRLGGWYAYRASKAAQNQLIRTFAVELSRLNPSGCCLLLHPGTVDTPLSRPFQEHLAKGQLQQPLDAARRLLNLAISAAPTDSGRFLAWDGSEIPW
ncbi:MAG: SDR family NAD(P)-dependent oxidoreductase [Xanthomonadales bacterium]|nr:SDR family NAD(P)-dependent oxidoreductase [Xanthomonadales bacterium]